MESFNGKLRDELLDRETFYALRQARVLTTQYRQTCLCIRSPSSLGYKPPPPAAILPAEPIPMLVGSPVVQAMGSKSSINPPSPPVT